MRILEKGYMPNNTPIQIEDWSEDYSFKPYGSTIGAYPKSNQTLEGQFRPRLNKEFRFQLEFDSYEEALEAIYSLVNGTSELIDYEEHFSGQKEFLVCV